MLAAGIVPLGPGFSASPPLLLLLYTSMVGGRVTATAATTLVKAGVHPIDFVSCSVSGVFHGVSEIVAGNHA
jgi:hypothetical protein